MKVARCALSMALAVLVGNASAYSRDASNTAGVMLGTSNVKDIEKHIYNDEIFPEAAAGKLADAEENANFLEVSAEAMQAAQILLELQEQLRSTTDKEIQNKFIRDAWNRMKQHGRVAFDKGLELVKNKASKVSKELRDKVLKEFNLVKDSAKEAGKGLYDEFKKQANGAVDVGKEMLNDIATKGLSEGWKSGKQRVKTFGKSAVDSLRQSTKDAGKKVYDTAKRAAHEGIEESEDILKRSASELEKEFEDSIFSVKDEASEVLQGVADKTQDKLGMAYDEFKEKALALTNDAHEVSMDVIQSTQKAIDDIKPENKMTLQKPGKNIRRRNIEEADTSASEE